MNPWMNAHESLVTAKDTIDRILRDPRTRSDNVEALRRQWVTDQHLVQAAVPFSWGKEAIDAVLAASPGIPKDTVFDGWNLPVRAAWWHFERPLDVQTVSDPNAKVRAICMGWIHDQFIITTWIDDHRVQTIPSQVWAWRRGETFQEMLDRIKKEHMDIYGPGGQFEFAAQVGEEIFMDASTRVSAFILAGLAWMSQRILRIEELPVQRHRRKDYERRHGVLPKAIRVIHLRKTEHAKTKDSGDDSKLIEWSCRWLVGAGTGGFWRNQACGPKMADRRLTYILPYMKGPDDKPLKEPAKIIFDVRR